MTKYNTGNPVGSADPRDLYDNAENADNFENGTAPAYADRLGKMRKSRAGMEKAFDDFLAASGYQDMGTYGAGIEFTAYNQTVIDGGTTWRPAAGTALPYTTTGAGMPEGGVFVDIGDAALRQDLSADPSTGRGATLVKGAAIYVGSVAELQTLSLNDGAAVSVESFWADQDTGGGILFWDAFRSKTDHNGISIIDPDRTAQLGSIGVYGTYFTAAVSGTGCYVRKDVSVAAMVEWAGAHEAIPDNSEAIQAVADNFTIICGLPKKTYSHGSKINLTAFNATLLSENVGNGYSGVTYQYDGVGDQFSCDAAVNYMNINRVHLKGVPAVGTDYYNTGSAGVNTSAGAVSVQCIESWLEGFQYLFRGNFNSFYNKFYRNRLEKFEAGVYQFSNNNLEFVGNRVQRFNRAIVHNGPNGPLTINNNSFEIFNGAISSATGVEQGIVNVSGNYVEIYDGEDLPTNFPASGSGAQPGKFGGNVLFTGPYKSLNIVDNEMQLDGVFRVVSASSMGHFKADGNNYHDFSSGSNLDRLYGLPICESVHINDAKGVTLGAGPYSRTYSQPAIGLTDPSKPYLHYDAITESVILATTKLDVQSMLNGWTQNSALYGPVRVLMQEGSLILSGLIDGTAKTGDIAFQVPAEYRPYEYGTAKSYANITAFSAFGGGSIVRFRYFYDTGDFRVEGAPASLADVSLDGLIIPPRF